MEGQDGIRIKRVEVVFANDAKILAEVQYARR